MKWRKHRRARNKMWHIIPFSYPWKALFLVRILLSSMLWARTDLAHDVRGVFESPLVLSYIDAISHTEHRRRHRHQRRQFHFILFLCSVCCVRVARVVCISVFQLRVGCSFIVFRNRFSLKYILSTRFYAQMHFLWVASGLLLNASARCSPSAQHTLHIIHIIIQQG